MSKAKVQANGFSSVNTTKRKGVHAKTKTSKTIKSKLYKKRYRGQGR